MENQKQHEEKVKSDLLQQEQGNSANGLDNWNDRLDENLEPNQHGDTSADDRARDFSEQAGSGDQSDEKKD